MERYILYPSLSKASNWTITLFKDYHRSRKKEKGNSPIYYPKSAKFPSPLWLTNAFLTKFINVLFGKAKAVAIQEEREPLIGTIMF